MNEPTLEKNDLLSWTWDERRNGLIALGVRLSCKLNRFSIGKYPQSFRTGDINLTKLKVLQKNIIKAQRI